MTLGHTREANNASSGTERNKKITSTKLKEEKFEKAVPTVNPT